MNKLQIVQEDLPTVNVRSLLRDYKNLFPVNKIMIITRREKPEGVLIPYEKLKEAVKEEAEAKTKINIGDLRKYFFKGPKNLSQEVKSIYK